MAAKQPKLVRGDTWQRAWVLKTAAGDPVDLTGATARLQLRDRSGTLVHESNTTNGELVVGVEPGRIELTVPYAVTETFEAGTYRFELEVTFSTGVRRTYESNALEVVADVTHD